MAFVVRVKLSSRSVMHVDVFPRDDVGTVKHRLLAKYGLGLENLVFIFQGRRLSDSFIIQDSDLQENSILHAVIADTAALSTDNRHISTSGDGNSCTSTPGDRHTATPGDENSCTSTPGDRHTATPGGENSHTVESESTYLVPVLDTDEPLSLTSPERSKCILYYVYCKDPCQAIQPGRIRVRCATCKQGAIELGQEPSCWDDVLKANKICGVCTQCGATTAEFYFKCSGHSCSMDEECCVVLPQISVNLSKSLCMTCGDVSSPVMSFLCHVSHVMCLPCFEQYCYVKLNERQFCYSADAGYTLGCPGGCVNSLVQEAHHFRLLGTHQYERYQRFAAEECLLQEGGVICPAPGCGEGMFPDDNTIKIQCIRPECQFIFCRNCRRVYHEGSPCGQAEENNTNHGERWSAHLQVCDPYEMDSLSTIHSTTKTCPQCNIPTERNEGCMHMTCSRCQFEWCWICHGEWSRDCQASHWFA